MNFHNKTCEKCFYRVDFVCRRYPAEYTVKFYEPELFRGIKYGTACAEYYVNPDQIEKEDEQTIKRRRAAAYAMAKAKIVLSGGTHYTDQYLESQVAAILSQSADSRDGELEE